MRVKLGDFLAEVSNKTTVNDQYPVLTASKDGIKLQSEYFNKDVASQDNTGYKIIKKGQYTYRAMSDTGKFYPNKLDCIDIGIVSPAYPVFEISNAKIVNADYLKYFFKSDSFQFSIAEFAQGSTRTSVKFNKIKTVDINLPSIEDQKNVVNKLDKINKIISLKKDELNKLDELVKSRFVSLFKDKEFNEVPLSKIATNKVNSAKKDFSNEDKIKYIDISSIDNTNNQMTGFTEYVLKDAPSRAQQHIVKNDIVVSTVRPNLKNVAINEYEYDNVVASSGFCVLRAIGDNLPLFIKSIVCSDDFTNAMTDVTIGANYPAIHDSDVMNYLIPEAPIELQKEFAEFVEKVDKSKFKVQESLNKTQQLFDSLMQEYFG